VIISLPQHPVIWVLGDPQAAHLALIDQLPEPKTVIRKNRAQDFAADAPTPHIFVNTGRPKEEVLPLWPRIQNVLWYHSLMAGMESQLFPQLIASSFPVTNAAAVFGNTLAEFAILSMLYFAKDVSRLERQRKERQWQVFDMLELRRMTLGIFGYGGIGQATAKLARSFGMKIIAARRTGGPDDFVDQVVKPDEFDSVLPQLDFLLISSPLTPATRGRFSSAQFSRLKPTSVVINLGRGPILVESDLIAALQSKTIAGAALDVFDVEPLPTEHPFWSMDNVLLSPHTADHTSTWLFEAAERFVENYHRARAGQPLIHLVDRHAGY
jgi:phosphoglycerate dehydrogenase-like enzyme